MFDRMRASVGNMVKKYSAELGFDFTELSQEYGRLITSIQDVPTRKKQLMFLNIKIFYGQEKVC